MAKKLFFILFLIVASHSFAATNNISYNNNKTNVLSNEVSVKIDLGDLTKSTDKEVRDKINSLISKTLKDVDAELTCSVTVKGTVSVGVAEVEISVTVSGPCSEVKAAGTEIANQVLDAAKQALKKAL